MPTFLFWNLRGKPLLPRVKRLTDGYAVDVLLLTECVEPAETVTAVLGDGWRAPFSPNQRFRTLIRGDGFELEPADDDPTERLSVRRIRAEGRPDVLLGVVHLLSRNNREGSSLASFAQRLAARLRGVEDREDHCRTVLVGDFNLSPWEAAMIGGEGFHALMTRELATRRNNRRVEGERRRAFFNPMWQFLTDRDGRPPGTYHRRASVPVNHFWYTLDHVLVRPEIAGRLSRVEIVEADGTESLLTANGWPDLRAGSDHLPLLFTLDW